MGAEKSFRIVNEKRAVKENSEETNERKRNLSAVGTRIPERNMDEQGKKSRRTSRKNRNDKRESGGEQ